MEIKTHINRMINLFAHMNDIIEKLPYNHKHKKYNLVFYNYDSSPTFISYSRSLNQCLDRNIDTSFDKIFKRSIAYIGSNRLTLERNMIKTYENSWNIDDEVENEELTLENLIMIYEKFNFNENNLISLE